MDRREFVGWMAAAGIAVTIGAIGGLTDKREPLKGSAADRRNNDVQVLRDGREEREVLREARR